MEQENTIVNSLRRLMDERGCTVNDLAKKLDVTPAAIRNYLNSRNEPSKENLYKLADIFGVKVSDITGRE